MLVLKNYEPELSHIIAGHCNMCFKNLVLYIVGNSYLVSLCQEHWG